MAVTANDFSVGLMHELAIALAKIGAEPKDIMSLIRDEEKLRSVLSKKADTNHLTTITVNLGLSLAEMITAGRYDWANGTLLTIDSRSSAMAKPGTKPDSSISAALSRRKMRCERSKSRAGKRPRSNTCLLSERSIARSSGSIRSSDSAPRARSVAVATCRASTGVTSSGT